MENNGCAEGHTFRHVAQTPAGARPICTACLKAGPFALRYSDVFHAAHGVTTTIAVVKMNNNDAAGECQCQEQHTHTFDSPLSWVQAAWCTRCGVMRLTGVTGEEEEDTSAPSPSPHSVTTASISSDDRSSHGSQPSTIRTRDTNGECMPGQHSYQNFRHAGQTTTVWCTACYAEGPVALIETKECDGTKATHKLSAVQLAPRGIRQQRCHHNFGEHVPSNDGQPSNTRLCASCGAMRFKKEEEGAEARSPIGDIATAELPCGAEHRRKRARKEHTL